MTLCPIAMAVGCKKCPIFGVCPVKGVIGDYKKEDDAREGRTRPDQGRGEKAPVVAAGRIQ